MLGLFAASLPLRRTPFALGLCLLAFLFAVEAKTAWYGPAHGIGSDVRAAKAMPALSPKLVDHGNSSLDRAQTHISLVAHSASTALWAPRVNVRAGVVRPTRPVLFVADYLSPSLLFRPPPVV